MQAQRSLSHQGIILFQSFSSRSLCNFSNLCCIFEVMTHSRSMDRQIMQICESRFLCSFSRYSSLLYPLHFQAALFSPFTWPLLLQESCPRPRSNRRRSVPGSLVAKCPSTCSPRVWYCCLLQSAQSGLSWQVVQTPQLQSEEELQGRGREWPHLHTACTRSPSSSFARPQPCQQPRWLLLRRHQSDGSFHHQLWRPQQFWSSVPQQLSAPCSLPLQQGVSPWQSTPSPSS